MLGLNHNLKVKYAIDSVTLQKTAYCKCDFSCLSGGKECLCEVERHVGNNGGVLFIKPKSDARTCKYLLSLRYKPLCICPTRKEIYRHYKI